MEPAAARAGEAYLRQLVRLDQNIAADEGQGASGPGASQVVEAAAVE